MTTSSQELNGDLSKFQLKVELRLYDLNTAPFSLFGGKQDLAGQRWFNPVSNFEKTATSARQIHGFTIV